MTDDPTGVTAALIQAGELKTSLGELDERERSDYERVRHAMDTLDGSILALSRTVGNHSDLLAGFKALRDKVHELAALLPPVLSDEKYQPSETPLWWEADWPGRGEKIATLRNFVREIWTPLYGHLSSPLGECWPQHPLALVVLDYVSEMWSVLHLNASRSIRDLAAQAEYQTRVLPALAEQLNKETTNCVHHVPRTAHNGAAPERMS